MLVAEGVGPVQAHLDLHFRLMHHDLLAELIEATCCFKSLGGIRWLDARQKRQVSSAVGRTGSCCHAVGVIAPWVCRTQGSGTACS